MKSMGCRIKMCNAWIFRSVTSGVDRRFGMVYVGLVAEDGGFMTLKVLDLFAGAGGFTLAGEMAGGLWSAIWVLK